MRPVPEAMSAWGRNYLQERRREGKTLKAKPPESLVTAQRGSAIDASPVQPESSLEARRRSRTLFTRFPGSTRPALLFAQKWARKFSGFALACGGVAKWP
ncbi:hypothetical protein [uncultured Desulfovibrio sp.]|uniref:hypothetical protein n=1 Tax=uncultured Desulfovibrio sp. TaxID=167968 RepID=UPI00262D31D2|nr:hypothetical protein [uncultured Desulfovibrio sp.]